MSVKAQMELPRGAGILLPVFSLPSKYGIGTFGKQAYKFIDFLKNAGQRYWQVLPLGQTGYGDSPYQCFSAFAGNPYFVDLELLIDDGLLKLDEVEQYDWGEDASKVNYTQLFDYRYEILKIASSRSRHKTTKAYDQFYKENAVWLEDYCLFMALRLHFDGKSWREWPEEIKRRHEQAIEKYSKLLKKDIEVLKFIQFKFWQQWNKLKAYANSKKIEIIGDIPIYVALDSVDAWASGEQFKLNKRLNPVGVAGVPPDSFSSTGQLWGNPLYNWKHMKLDGFAWWKERMEFCSKMYDIIRIDHFVGFANYYSVPARHATALKGRWINAPGKQLINAINEAIGDKKIIAEDLGVITPKVRALIKYAGYPGMKLMEHAFDSDTKNPNLPAYFEKNCVVYGGTHDNETLVGYFSDHNKKVINFAIKYLNVSCKEHIPQAIIRAAYASVANTVIFQMQDYLELDNSARINVPATIGGNWCWRMTADQIDNSLATSINELVKLYGREI